MKRTIKNLIRLSVAAFAVMMIINGCSPQKNTGNMPVTTSSKKAKSLFKEAQALMFRDKNKEAQPLLTSALQLDKNFALANLYYGFSGVSNAEMQQYVDAAYQSKDKVSEPERHYIMAISAYLKGNRDETLKEMKTAIDLCPRDKYLLYDMANTYANYAQYDNALEYIKRCVETDTTFAYALNYEGYILFRLGKPEEAEALYKKSIQMDPGITSFYNNYGQLLRSKGAFDEAIEMHKKAIGIEPNYMSYLYLGHCYVANGQYPAARENYTKAFDVSVNPSQKNFCLTSVAYTHLYEGSFPDALAAFDKQIDFDRQAGKMDNSIINITAYKCFCCLLYNDLKKAEELNNEAKGLISKLDLTERDRNSFVKDTLFWNAYVNLFTGKTAEAQKCLDQYEKCLTDQEKKDAEKDLAVLQGIIEYFKHNYKEATLNLEKSDGQLGMYYNALAYEKMKNNDKAKEVLSEIVKNNLTSFEIAVTRPLAREKLEELSK
ncbi:MAG: tetratricopeptide repeat protein [Bacteroidales bacterium]